MDIVVKYEMAEITSECTVSFGCTTQFARWTKQTGKTSAFSRFLWWCRWRMITTTTMTITVKAMTYNLFLWLTIKIFLTLNSIFQFWSDQKEVVKEEIKSSFVFLFTSRSGYLSLFFFSFFFFFSLRQECLTELIQ